MSESRGLVVVVEDESAIADLLRLYLTREGFGVRVESNGEAALAAITSDRPVAVVLDVGLPGGMDGTEVCRALREAQDWTPVLFCTARDDEVDRVLGLELGADDYITKPFSPREVVARVKAVLRRGNAHADAADVLVMANVVVDRNSRRCTVDGSEIALTPTEFELLVHLMSKPGRVFSREHLLSAVWGYSSVVGSRTVDVHVAQLRSKLGESGIIRTVRGVGYSADEQAADERTGE
jgi:DNA-binding response OmpR family regulator